MGAGAKSDLTRIQIADISDTVYDHLARCVRRGLRLLGVNSGIPLSSTPPKYQEMSNYYHSESKLAMSPPLAQTFIPSVVRNIGNDHIFIGSTGPIYRLKAARVEEEDSRR